jgi:prevent-host-death family protein
MSIRIPLIHPISDLARDARALVAKVQERQEPVVITQRGPEVAVLLPVEVYRELEARSRPRIASPRLVKPEDTRRFEMTMTVVDSSQA